MPFINRARAVYATGNVVGAVVTLVEGLKRYPEDVDAFRWLLDLYCEEIDNPGLEEDLVKLFDRSPDPPGLYMYVFGRLSALGRDRLVTALDRAHRDVAKRDGIILPHWEIWRDALAAAKRQQEDHARQRAAVVHSEESRPPTPVLESDVAADVAAEDEGWDRDLPAHPLLMQRQERRRSPRPNLSRSDPSPIQSAMSPPVARSLPQDDVPDLDALMALSEPVSAATPSDSSWLEDRRRREGRTGGRRWWIPVSVVLVVAIGVASAFRLAEVTEAHSGSDPVEGDAFLPSQLAETESELGAQLDREPESEEVRAKLRWTQSLHAYLSPHADDGPSLLIDRGEAAPQGLRAFYIAADVLDKIRTHKTADARRQNEELLVAMKDAPAFPSELEHWLSGEVNLASGDLSAAQLAFEKSADGAFVPGVIGLADACLRRGDLPCARRALTTLGRVAPEHPGQRLGLLAVAALAELLDDPLATHTPSQTEIPGDLETAAMADRRLVVWLGIARGGEMPEGYTDMGEPHPALALLRARRFLEMRSMDAAVAELQKFSKVHATSRLRRTYRTVAVSGLAQSGRPELALDNLPTIPKDPDEVRAYVLQNPEPALQRAGLLADLGRFDDARVLLSQLLKDPVRASAARIIALQLHLAEGRIDDVRRHIDRLNNHRGALVAAAAIDLYEGRPGSALAVLGPTTGGELPNPATEPYLYAFEVRTRVLALKDAGRTEDLDKLLKRVTVSPALKVRVLGRARATEEYHLATSTHTASINDRIDLALEALEFGDTKEARRWAASVLENVPDHTEAHRVLAHVQLEAGDGAAAAKAFKIAIRGRSDRDGLVLGIPRAELLQNEPLEAVSDLVEYLDRHPSNPAAIRLLGEAYFKASYFTVGRKDFDRRLETLDGGRDTEAVGECYYWMARFVGTTKRDTEAGVYLRQAREHLGDRPDVLTALGDFYRARDDDSHAFELYRLASETQARRQAPASAHLSLAKMALVRGDRPMARAALERYVATGAGGEGRSWAKRELARLVSVEAQ